MKDTLQVVLFAVIFAVLGIRLYNKYFKKGDAKLNNQKNKSTSFTSSSKDDDYEPYAKK